LLFLKRKKKEDKLWGPFKMVKHEKLKHQPKMIKNLLKQRRKRRRGERKNIKKLPISEWVATVHG
jgi:hypothetical protein